MSLVAFDDVPVQECREPLANVGRFPFLPAPVYFHNGWADTPHLYARVGLLDKLARVQRRHLSRRGWQWVVYDAWRPRSVQAAIFQHYWRTMSAQAPGCARETLEKRVRTYVTIPAQANRIPPHSTGGAVDLGWWDRHTGRLVPMGSDFDEFCPAAANNFFETPGRDAQVRQRRSELTDWLAAEDIASDADEWFHKDYGNQKWAAQQGRPVAFYGEVLSCEGPADKPVVRWGADEPEALRHTRLGALASSLDLSHPAASPARQLPAITECLLRSG